MALAVLVFLPAWLHPTATVVGYSGDVQQSIWFLSWTPWAVQHGVNPFFTTHINYPDGINLMWDAWAPLLGFVLWPVTALGGPVLSYNVLITADIGLSAWLAYVAARRYLGGTASLAVGLVYGFGPFLMDQAHAHAKVSLAVLPPLLFILLDEICVRRRWPARRLGIILGLVLSAQVFVLEESVVLAAIAALVGVAALALVFRHEVAARWRRVAVAGLWCAGVFAIFATAPLAIQLFGSGRVHGTVPGADVYVTDPVALVVPTHLQWFSWGDLSARIDTFAGNDIETGMYLGIPLVAVILLTLVVWRRRPLVRWLAVTLAAMTVLSFGPHLHLNGHFTGITLPYWVVQMVSHVGSALPSRLFVYVELLAALVLGVFVDELVRLARAVPRRIVPVMGGAALVGLTAITLVPETPFTATSLAVPSYFTSSQVADDIDADSVALVAPFVQDGSFDDAMVWQAASGLRFKMPEGYFIRPNQRAQPRADGPAPTPTSKTMIAIARTGRAPKVTDKLRHQVLADLARWKVTTVVVGPMANQKVMSRFFAELFGAPAVQRGGVLVWHVSR